MRDRAVIPRRLTISIALLLGVVVLGTAGYTLLEGYSWFDAFYATVTTITTIGGGEVRPFHLWGKIWTMVVVGVGFFVAAIAKVGDTDRPTVRHRTMPAIR